MRGYFTLHLYYNTTYGKDIYACVIDFIRSYITELTPEILQAFIDKVIIHEKQKIDGKYHQSVEIIYNFIGAIEPPDFDD